MLVVCLAGHWLLLMTLLHSFHIFYCNSAGLSDVFRYNGVFVIAVFHSIVWHSLSYKEDTKFPNISLCLKG